MHKRHDLLTKRLLRGFFEPEATFSTEEEISPDAQRFDGYLIPSPALASRTDDLLYRLGSHPCAFEVWSDAPSAEDLAEGIRKLLNARHVFALARPPKPLPYLWILCAGHPRAALPAIGATESKSLGAGVLEAPPAFHTGVVVLSLLPETRETLFLRLMGRGATLKRALVELAGLPEDARERRIALPVLLNFRVEIQRDPARTPEEEEFVQETRDIVKALKDEGRDEERREALLDLYRARFGAVPPEVDRAISSASYATLRSWLPTFAIRSADEILSAITAPASAS